MPLNFNRILDMQETSTKKPKSGLDFDRILAMRPKQRSFDEYSNITSTQDNVDNTQPKSDYNYQIDNSNTYEPNFKKMMPRPFTESEDYKRNQDINKFPSLTLPDNIKPKDNSFTPTPFETALLKYNDETVGLISKLFGKTAPEFLGVGDIYTPEVIAKGEKANPVSAVAGSVAGSIASPIMASLVTPASPISAPLIFGGIAGAKEAGNQITDSSIMTPNQDKILEVAKKASQGAILGKAWDYANELSFIGKPVISALTRAGAKGASSAGLSTLYGDDLNTALANGGIVTALSLMLETPPLVKTGLGRKIITEANRVAKESGLPDSQIEINIDKLDQISQRTSLFNLVKNLFDVSKKKGQNLKLKSLMDKPVESQTPVETMPSSKPPEPTTQEQTAIRRDSKVEPPTQQPIVEIPTEIWQTTKREYLAVDKTSTGATKHKQAVSNAIKEGKPVPKEVLADYNNLVKKYGIDVNNAPSIYKEPIAQAEQTQAIAETAQPAQTTKINNIENKLWAYDNYKNNIVPEGWYVHGRNIDSNGELTNYMAQLTKDWAVAESYGRKGAMYLIKPKGNAIVYDFTNINSPELNNVIDKIIEEYHTDELPFKNDIEYMINQNEIDQSEVDEFIKEIMIKSLRPEKIVMSAEFYDNPDMVAWLEDRFDVDFIKTPDGAIALDPKNNPNIDKVKVPTSTPQIEQTQTIAQQSIAKKPSQKTMASSSGNPIGEFETIDLPNKAPDDFKLFNESAKLLDKYLSGVWGESKMPRKVRGLFYNHSGNVFVNALNNVSTVVHEITHAIDQKTDYVKQFTKVVNTSSIGNPIYDSTTKGIRKQLSDVYINYYPTSSASHPVTTRVKEGLATFIQKYIEQPSLMEKEYPDLVRDIINPNGKYHNKTIAELIKDTRENIIVPYQSLDELDKIGSRITNKSKPDIEPTKYLSKWDTFISEATDAIYPLEKLSKEAKSDMYLYAYHYQNGLKTIISNNIFSNKGYAVFANGSYTKKYDFNYKSIVKSLKQKGLVDRFDSYLVARRNHFLFKKLDELDNEITNNKDMYNPVELQELQERFNDINTILYNDGFTRAEIDKGYLDNKNNFTEEEKMFDTINQEHLNLLKEANLITQKQYNEFSQIEGYASFKRQIYDELLGLQDKQATSIKIGGTKVSSLKKRTGGMQTIVSPLFSSIQAENEISRKAIKQIVYNKFIPIAQQMTGLFEIPELIIAVDQSRNVTYPQEKDNTIIMARNSEGKRIPIKAKDEIKTVVDECLNPANIHIVEKVATWFSKMFSIGTTQYFPAFAVANTLIDQFTALSQSKNNYIPIYSTLKLLYNQVSNSEDKPSEYLREYLMLGGERQTFAGWQNAEPKELLNMIDKEHKLLNKITGLIEDGIGVLGLPSQASEIFTRSQEYILARLNGKSQFESMEDAGRVTAPFHHRGRLGGGTAGNAIVSSIPYLRASMQVLTQSAKSMNMPRFWFTMALLTVGLIGSQQYFLKKASDNQIRKLKNIDVNMLSKYLWFPHLNGKDLLRFRVPEGMSVLGQMINMVILEHLNITDYNKEEYLDVATSFIPDNFNPKVAIMETPRFILSWTPQIIKPSVEVAYNRRSFPRVTDLIPKSLQDELPKNQFTNSTTGYVKWLGDELNTSPIVIDHLVGGYFGRATNPSKQISNPIIQKMQLYGYRQVQNLYDMSKYVDFEYKQLSKDKDEYDKTTDEYKNFIMEMNGKTKYVKEGISTYKEAVKNNEPEEVLAGIESQILDTIDTLPTFEEVKAKRETKYKQGL